MKWSNGASLTGADVAYSINLSRTNTNSPYNANVATVKDAVANGQYGDGHVQGHAWLQ